jgi:hypothetical protein
MKVRPVINLNVERIIDGKKDVIFYNATEREIKANNININIFKNLLCVFCGYYLE